VVSGINIATSVGAFYVTPDFYRITWPVEFTSQPEEFIGINGGGNNTNYFWLIFGSIAGTVTQSAIFWVARPTSVSNVNITVSFHAKGRWK
jgi:hypothetical protein